MSLVFFVEEGGTSADIGAGMRDVGMKGPMRDAPRGDSGGNKIQDSELDSLTI